MKRILAVETSCDDTSAAIVREDGFVEFNKSVQQNSTHQPHGGIVPELAGRNHTQNLLPLIDEALGSKKNPALNAIDGLAVTTRPGLIGSLMAGLVTVKTLSLAFKKPYVAVNHIEGHLLSPFLWDQTTPRPPEPAFPFLALIASGAHTHLFLAQKPGRYTILGQALDDAAGEALDKFARALGLSYPGGAQIDRLAQNTPRGRYAFPQVKLKQKNSLNFSFSGLKTAGAVLIQKLTKKEISRYQPNLCADYQEAIVDHLLNRLNKAAARHPVSTIAIAGGVSANSRLRQKAEVWAKQNGRQLIWPQKTYCTDNAAMIGLAGFRLFLKKQYSPQNLNCTPHFLPEDFLPS